MAIINGMRLSKFLSEHGIAPMVFGRQIGLQEPNSIYRYLRGDRMPTRAMLLAIHRETDGAVTANDFMETIAERESAVGEAGAA